MDYSKYFWQGDKVRLRPLRPEDAEECYEQSLDSPTRQSLQLGIELPTSVEAQRRFLEKYADCKEVDGITIFGIEDLEGNWVGGLSIHSCKQESGTFSMGMNTYAGYRRRGYAEDAARIVMRYCFHERRYQKCNSGCIEGNEASIGLHRKLGFVEEGRCRRNFFMNGRYYDDVLFGLTREEFDEQEEQR